MNNAESSFYEKLHADPGPFEGGAKQGLFNTPGAPEDVAAHTGIGAAAASPAPKKNRKRKYIYGGLLSGFVVVGLAVAVYIDMTAQQPAPSTPMQAAHTPTPAPDTSATAAGMNPGSGVMGSGNAPQTAGAEPAPSTVMGGGDAGTRQEVVQAPPPAPVIPPQPVHVAAATQPDANVAPVQLPAASPARSGSTAAQLAAAPVEMKQVTLKPSAAEVSEANKPANGATAEPAKAPNDAALMKRLAALEKELADLRSRDQGANSNVERRVSRAAASAEPRATRAAQLKNADKSDLLAKADEPKSTLREVSRTGSKAGSESVRILGVTMRPVGSMALIEFAGVKQRYAEGDSVPGLGTVGAVALQDGQPTVTINGVVYR